MPRMSAPILTSRRARSWTCGSQAALWITVVPGRQRGRHQHVLGRHHRRLVHQHVAGAQAAAARAARSCRRSRRRAPSASKASMCGSRRRRPMKSPPGGGISARPSRASSGPASRNEARMRSPSVGVDGARVDVGAAQRQLVLAAPADAHAEAGDDLEHRVDVADARDVAERAARRRSAPTPRSARARRSCCRPGRRCR